MDLPFGRQLLWNVRLRSLLFLRSKLSPLTLLGTYLVSECSTCSPSWLVYDSPLSLALYCTASPFLRTAPHSLPHSPAAHCGRCHSLVAFSQPCCALWHLHRLVPLSSRSSLLSLHCLGYPCMASAILDGCVSHIVAQSPDYIRPETPTLYFLSF